MTKSIKTSVCISLLLSLIFLGGCGANESPTSTPEPTVVALSEIITEEMSEDPTVEPTAPATVEVVVSAETQSSDTQATAVPTAVVEPTREISAEVATIPIENADGGNETTDDESDADPANVPAEPQVLVNQSGAQEGYLLIAPFWNKETLILDMEGNTVHSWTSEHLPGQTSYLLENGDLLRAGAITESVVFSDVIGFGAGGIVETFSWDGELKWQYRLADDRYLQHHDIEPLPNGNVLLLAFELISVEDMLALGRQPELIPEDADGIWSEAFLELDPVSGDIVWEWHAIDHVVQDYDAALPNYGEIANSPERININYIGIEEVTGLTSDWIHANALDYNSELDQIMMTSRHFSEFWIIDHSTTVEEAADNAGGAFGRGGDLLYRYGNPEAYGIDDPELRTAWTPHDGRWIGPGVPGTGNITLFSNGNEAEQRAFSMLLELEPTLNEAGQYELTTAETVVNEIVWEWTAPEPESFFSAFMSGIDKQPNGNYLVTASVQGRIFEMSPNADLTWDFQNAYEPFPWIFRGTRYLPDYPGLLYLDLSD